jgi:hypothetical protein
MKIIIAGSRNFKDYQRLCKVCDYMLQFQTDIEIVSGAAMGADKLGEKYADERKFLIKQFPAEWGKYKNLLDIFVMKKWLNMLMH